MFEDEYEDRIGKFVKDMETQKESQDTKFKVYENELSTLQEENFNLRKAISEEKATSLQVEYFNLIQASNKFNGVKF
jgi:predicted transcriptional regulator